MAKLVATARFDLYWSARTKTWDVVGTVGDYRFCVRTATGPDLGRAEVILLAKALAAEVEKLLA